MIVVDTDIRVYILRRFEPAMAWLDSIGDEEIYLPGFVVMELIQGCRNKSEQERVEETLKPFEVTWPSSDTCNEALSVFSRFHTSHQLGLLDALIGQMAVAVNNPLHTFNSKHYAMIPNLKTVQPYAK